MDLKKSINVALAMTGITREELARRIGVTRPTLSTMTTRNACPSSKLEALAAAFGMKVSEFIALGE